MLRLASGGHHSCAVLQARDFGFELWCWGLAGSASSLQGLSPRRVAASQGNIVEVAAGGGFACATLRGLQCAGTNSVGQLGSAGDFLVGSRPIEPFGGNSGTNFLGSLSLAAGAEHVCSISGSQVWCWGSNSAGQLGTVAPPNLGGPAFSRGALPVTLAGVRQVSAGREHTCAVTVAGDAYCWGSNSHGQLGNGSSNAARNQTPALVLGGVKFVGVSAGGYHTCGATADGSLYCWGRNDKGQLGDGTTVNRLTPVRVGEAP